MRCTRAWTTGGAVSVATAGVRALNVDSLAAPYAVSRAPEQSHDAASRAAFSGWPPRCAPTARDTASFDSAAVPAPARARGGPAHAAGARGGCARRLTAAALGRAAPGDAPPRRATTRCGCARPTSRRASTTTDRDLGRHDGDDRDRLRTAGRPGPVGSPAPVGSVAGRLGARAARLGEALASFALCPVGVVEVPDLGSVPPHLAPPRLLAGTRAWSRRRARRRRGPTCCLAQAPRREVRLGADGEARPAAGEAGRVYGGTGGGFVGRHHRARKAGWRTRVSARRRAWPEAHRVGEASARRPSRSPTSDGSPRKNPPTVPRYRRKKLRPK